MKSLSAGKRLAYIFAIGTLALFGTTGHLSAERIYGNVYHNGVGWWSYILDDLREISYTWPGFNIEPATPGYRSLFVQSTGAPHLYVPEVYLPVGGELYLELDTDPVYHVPSGPKVVSGAPSQRFVADDGNHVMGFHWAAVDRHVDSDIISIHLGDPNGPQIGPGCKVYMCIFDVSIRQPPGRRVKSLFFLGKATSSGSVPGGRRHGEVG